MTKRIQGICLCLLPLLAAGCASVGPNYRPAQTQVPASWPTISTLVSSPPAIPVTPQTTSGATTAASMAASNAAVLTASLPSGSICSSGQPTENLAQWWTVFNDPILNQLISDAMACNLDLKQAQQRIYQARENRCIVEAALFPQINANESFQKTRSGGSGGLRRSGTLNLFQHGLDAAWELDFFGGTRRAVESAEANIDATIEDRRNITVTVIAEVGTSYIDLRGFQKELAIARENVVSQQRSVDLTDKKFKAGISNALDVANARALVATTRAQIPVLETAAQQMTYTIAVLLGKEPAALDEMLNKVAPIPLPPPAIPLGLPSELLCRRPDVRRAQALVHAATAQIGVATSDLFPKFSLTGNFGLQGQKPSSLVSLSNRFYSVGPAINWPIFAGGRIACNIALQKTLEVQSEITFQQTVLQALQEVDNSVFAFAKEKEHHDALYDAVVAYQQVVNLSLKLYQDGSTDFLNVITAQRSLYLAQDQLAQSDRDLAVDVVAIYKALGGGWTESEVIECHASSPVAATMPEAPRGTHP